MATVTEHYALHLAPIYLWMAGGMEHALRLGTLDVASLGLPARHDDLAVDLGAGFGMHAIPLARMGYGVVAIDTSPELIDELGMHADGLAIRPIVADLVDFRMHVPGRASLILCMGDTLTHLDSKETVEQLFADVALALTPGGRFVTTFRDYTILPAGEARFIPVRSDEARIQACFLEEQGDSVFVHDIVHERHGDTWMMKVSAYPKLRLDPLWVAQVLERNGLAVVRDAGPRGMVRIIATRKGN
jgi:SAM-dependent methyltransferase